MTLLDDLGTTIQDLASTVGPSVVGIGRHTRGSGVVVADGRVLTNAHNLRSDTISVTFATDASVQGKRRRRRWRRGPCGHRGRHGRRPGPRLV